jgi:cell division cycle 2-like protein
VDKVYVVMEYMEHELKQLMENVKHEFSWGEIKCLIK